MLKVSLPVVGIRKLTLDPKTPKEKKKKTEKADIFLMTPSNVNFSMLTSKTKNLQIRFHWQGETPLGKGDTGQRKGRAGRENE